MEFYSLESEGHNDGTYEDAWDFETFHGIFSTIEKAKEYAEKLMEQIRKDTKEVEDWDDDGNTPLSYRETFKVVEDWYESKGVIFKDITYGEGYTNEWTVTYSISKVTVDPEFKEDK